MTHPLDERATVAHRAGALDLLAGRANDIALRGLALHPITPFIGGHVLLRRVEHRRVVALAVEEGAGPAGQIPVDEFIGSVERLALEMARHPEPGGPGAVALLERLIGARDAHLAHLGDGWR